ncbi:MAG: FAD-dependent thymidylate synthase [Acidilobus sp.]
MRATAIISELGLGITVKLIQYAQDAPRIVAAASKMSVSRKGAEDLLSIGDEEIEVWIRETLKRGHLSPWEHASYTLVAEGCSRVCSHQLVRHRIASYTQQSMRYTEASLRDMALRASGLVGVECPARPKGEGAREAYSCYARALRQAAEALEGAEVVRLAWTSYVIPPSLAVSDERLMTYAKELLEATSRYYELLARGAPREDARFVIPMSVRTKITFTMNARELIQSFLPLRMCSHAQWEIRHVAWLTWKELVSVHPQLFKYAGPSCVFLNNAQLDNPAPLEDYLNGKAEFVISRCPELVERHKVRSCLLFAYRSLSGNPLRWTEAPPGDDKAGGAG